MRKLKPKILFILTILAFQLSLPAQASGRQGPPVAKTATAPADGGWFQPFWDLFNW